MCDAKMKSEIIKNIKEYNNTNVWEHQGNIYIDTLKVSKPFRAIAQAFNLDLVELHIETKEACLFGCDASDLEFGGRKTICHVYMIHKV